MKLIAVTRVSTRKSWAKGSSIEDQEKQVREYAETIGAEVVEVIRIQVSGKRMTLNQSQLSDALHLAQKMDAELACSRLDRMSRHAISILQLKEATDNTGIDIHIASLGRTMKQMSHSEVGLAALMADSERRAIQSRVKRACRDRIGPIGLSLDAKALQLASTQSRQKSAIDWANSIGLKEEIINAGANLKRPTLENLCYWLNGKGKLTRRGAKWKSGSLHQQLKRFGWSLKELVGC